MDTKNKSQAFQRIHFDFMNFVSIVQIEIILTVKLVGNLPIFFCLYSSNIKHVDLFIAFLLFVFLNKCLFLSAIIKAFRGIHFPWSIASTSIDILV